MWPLCKYVILALKKSPVAVLFYFSDSSQRDCLPLRQSHRPGVVGPIVCVKRGVCII